MPLVFLNLGLKDIEENLSDAVTYCFSQVQPFFFPEAGQSCPSQSIVFQWHAVKQTATTDRQISFVPWFIPWFIQCTIYLA